MCFRSGLGLGLGQGGGTRPANSEMNLSGPHENSPVCVCFTKHPVHKQNRDFIREAEIINDDDHCCDVMLY